MHPEETDLQSVAARIGGRLLQSGLRLVTAESCTGGWIGKLCTDQPGSSRWYEGGAVVYSNALKIALLAVSPATLAAHGAVSEPVVREMAVGALHRLGGNLSVAVSGIAGPDGGTPDKPVGTVWLGWALRRGEALEVRVLHRVFAGDRDAVRRAAVHAALSGLVEF